VTDRQETMFTSKERVACYLKSISIVGPYFVLVVILNIIFLNLTGIINPEKHHALFQIAFLSDLCQHDALFDVNSNMALIPTLV